MPPLSLVAARRMAAGVGLAWKAVAPAAVAATWRLLALEWEGLAGAFQGGMLGAALA